MKTKIEIGFEYHPIRIGEITWAADEDFTELNKLGTIHLIDTKAVDIDKMGGLSTTSRILLSAVAGAAWQYIFDNTDIDESKYPRLIININKHKVHASMETLLSDLDDTGFATDCLIDNGIETLGELIDLLQQPKKFCSIRGFGWGKVISLYHILNTLDLDDKVPPEIRTHESFDKMKYHSKMVKSHKKEE